MKIYTKKGDGGTTALIGGTRVAKHTLRIECYGTVDELNSFIGVVRDSIPAMEAEKKILLEVQDRLFTLGSSLASDPAKSKMSIPDLKEEDITLLENEIDHMNNLMPELKSFILPGGNAASSMCHVARCVCRRAERLTVELHEKENTDSKIIPYLNRLSDYLFVLARFISFSHKSEEILWKPRI